MPKVNDGRVSAIALVAVFLLFLVTLANGLGTREGFFAFLPNGTEWSPVIRVDSAKHILLAASGMLGLAVVFGIASQFRCKMRLSRLSFMFAITGALCVSLVRLLLGALPAIELIVILLLVSTTVRWASTEED